MNHVNVFYVCFAESISKYISFSLTQVRYMQQFSLPALLQAHTAKPQQQTHLQLLKYSPVSISLIYVEPYLFGFLNDFIRFQLCSIKPSIQKVMSVCRECKATDIVAVKNWSV